MLGSSYVKQNQWAAIQMKAFEQYFSCGTVWKFQSLWMTHPSEWPFNWLHENRSISPSRWYVSDENYETIALQGPVYCAMQNGANFQSVCASNPNVRPTRFTWRAQEYLFRTVLWISRTWTLLVHWNKRVTISLEFSATMSCEKGLNFGIV